MDQISKNWNTNYLPFLKYKDHFQNAQYINNYKQDQDLYDTEIRDFQRFFSPICVKIISGGSKLKQVK